MNEQGVRGAIDEVLRDVERAHDVPDREERIAGLLGPAKDDLTACTLLYNAGLYALSTYHLQQGAEKTTKAYLIYTNIITIEEVRSIRHDSLRGHIRLVEKMLGCFRKMHGPSENLAKEFRALGLLKKVNRQEVANLSYEQIMGMVESVHFMADPSSALVTKVIEILRNREDVRSFFERAGIEGETADQGADIVIHFVSQEGDVAALTSAGAHLPLLYVVSAVTFPHMAYTRYSDDIIKPRDYTMDMGIVKATPELNRRMMDVVTYMEQLS